MNFVAIETKGVSADLKRRPFSADVFRQLCSLAAELTRQGVRLTEAERETMRVAREYLDIALKNEAYWAERVG